MFLEVLRLLADKIFSYHDSTGYVIIFVRDAASEEMTGFKRTFREKYRPASAKSGLCDAVVPTNSLVKRVFLCVQLVLCKRTCNVPPILRLTRQVFKWEMFKGMELARRFARRYAADLISSFCAGPNVVA